MSLVYVDTSVLAKRYLRSPASDAVDDLLDSTEHRFALSELSLVEMESVLARHARASLPRIADVPKLRLQFDRDLSLGFFSLLAVSAGVLAGARLLVAGQLPFATLDSIHLATALHIDAAALATDDRQLARAASANGLKVISFLSSP